MSRRIDIELTSTRPDGTWTWRAAGAREPKGVLDGSLLPAGAAVGHKLKAEAETEIDGITIVAVAGAKGSTPRTGLLEIKASDKPFEAVTQQLAKRDRNDRGDRGDRGGRGGGGRFDRGDRPDRGERPPRRPRDESAGEGAH
jgi:hypothetical protein